MLPQPAAASPILSSRISSLSQKAQKEISLSHDCRAKAVQVHFLATITFANRNYPSFNRFRNLEWNRFALAGGLGHVLHFRRPSFWAFCIFGGGTEF